MNKTISNGFVGKIFSKQDDQEKQQEELYTINAQVRFYTNQDIELCWGYGRILPNMTVYAGIHISDNMYLSVPGSPFRGGPTGYWPEGRCQTFASDDILWL
jgi:hypothetical protein